MRDYLSCIAETIGLFAVAYCLIIIGFIASARADEFGHDQRPEWSWSEGTDQHGHAIECWTVGHQQWCEKISGSRKADWRDRLGPNPWGEKLGHE